MSHPILSQFKLEMFYLFIKPFYLFTIVYIYIANLVVLFRDFMTDEKIVGIIPNTHTGFFGNKCYNLIVTDKRLVVAELTSAMIKESSKKASEESKARGEGILKRMAGTAFSGVNYYDKYFSMPMDQIISENPNNFIIDPSMVNKIRLSSRYIDADQTRFENEIKIKWSGGKTVFKFNSISKTEAKNILENTFPSKVK